MSSCTDLPRTIYRPGKTSLKRTKVKIHLPKHAPTKELSISTMFKNLGCSKVRCIIYRPDLQNLKTRKKKQHTYVIVRIELSVNENTNRSEI